MRHRAPRIVAADALLPMVDGQGDLVARDQVDPVALRLGLAAVEVLDRVGERGEGDGGQPRDEEPGPGAIGDRHPARVGAGAGFLRAHVRVGELGDRGRVAADGGPRAPIPVVLVGSAPVPLDPVEVAGEREDRAETGHLREVLVDVVEARGDGRRAVGVDFVGEGVARPDRPQREVAGDRDGSAVRLRRDRHRVEVAGRRTPREPPHAGSHREAVSVVVVGGGAPEVRGRAREEELAVAQPYRGQGAGGAVEAVREVVAAHPDRVGRLLGAERAAGKGSRPGAQLPMVVLFPRNDMARRQQRRVLPSSEDDVENDFDSVPQSDHRHPLQVQRVASTRRRGERRQGSHIRSASIDHALPRPHQVGEVREGPPVLHHDP